MKTSPLDALTLRRGHFRYESGHHGDLWLDLDPLFADPLITRRWARALAGHVDLWGVEVVCGPLTGGALLAQLLALELGVGFVYSERWLPPEGGVSYQIPGGLRRSLSGRRALVVDDAINAGSAVSRTLAELDACGASPVGVVALLTMGPAAADIAAQRNIPLFALATLERQMWHAAACPLCAQGVAIDALT